MFFLLFVMCVVYSSDSFYGVYPARECASRDYVIGVGGHYIYMYIYYMYLISSIIRCDPSLE